MLRKKRIKTRPGGEIITIVSGLPRSGTSMMMSMLEAGGMKLFVDNLRTADEDNPKGYYELEKVRKLKEDSSWLKDARGTAIKIISMLLFYLPQEEKYHILFMRRDLSEILASQKQMLARRGVKKNHAEDGAMGRLFQKHLGEVGAWMNGQRNIQVIDVDYSETIRNPFQNAQRINQFLGASLDVESMAEVVDKMLYRQRQGALMP